MRADLQEFLRQAGASPDDITRAEAEGWLPLLALECRLTPGKQKYDVAGLANELGVDESLVRRLWRSLGFPDVPAGLAVFTDEDLRAAKWLLRDRDRGPLDLEGIFRVVRVNSAAMSRIAAAETESLATLIHDLRGNQVPDDEIALELVRGVPWDDVSALLDYSHRI